MPLVVPDAGELRLLGYIVNQLTPTNLVLHLYENDDVDLSTEDFNTSSFTEVSDASYSSAPLVGDDWTISSNAGISSAIWVWNSWKRVVLLSKLSSWRAFSRAISTFLLP